MIDLPASEAPPPAPSNAVDGPAEPATAAAAATPSAAAATPREEAVDVPPVPGGGVAAKPADPAEEAAAPAAAAAEVAPPASPSPDPSRQENGDEARPRPSAHAITLWQLALVRRLDAARRHLPRRPTAEGTATVAFSVGGHGELVAARIATSSGSRALDDVALQLVRRAAPFQAPPAGSRGDELSFTVPVRFR